MNKYQLYARILPSVISSIPILIFQYFFITKEFAIFLQYLGGLNIMGNFSISIVILYFLSQTNRFIAKNLFEKKETHMPTTDFLLFSDQEYSKEYKQIIYTKIQQDFDLQIPTERSQKENELNSRRIISEAMSLVRKKVGSGKLLYQHNIEYGFWRNLVGGTFFAILFSGLDVYFASTQSNDSILILSILLLIVYLTLLLFNKYIIQKTGVLYARVLIQEYMVN